MFGDQNNNDHERELTLPAGLDQFATVYMPARNYSSRTRKEYAADLAALAGFLEGRGVLTWTVVSLRDLQHYLAELDRRGLEPSSRNRKTYAIKTFFGFLKQAGYLHENPAKELIPTTIRSESAASCVKRSTRSSWPRRTRPEIGPSLRCSCKLVCGSRS